MFSFPHRDGAIELYIAAARGEGSGTVLGKGPGWNAKFHSSPVGPESPHVINIYIYIYMLFFCCKIL